MKIFRSCVLNFVYWALVAIPTSLFLDAAAWFFFVLLLRIPLPDFLEVWRGVYIVLVALAGGYETLRFLAMICACLFFCAKWKVGFKDVEEAVMVHKLPKKYSGKWQLWTREEFLKQLELARAVDAFTGSISKSLFRRT